MAVYKSEELKRFIVNILTKLQVQSDQAAIAADSLVRADLEGVSSHGISRLPIYAKRLREKRINPQPTIKIEQKAPAILSVDGDNGLGQIVAFKAFQEGINAAEKNGVAAVAICNSNHFGCASYYCQLGFEKSIASIVTTNSPPGIPPWGGKKAFFGTNPIAFGFPLESADDLLIDLSSSIAARGKIIEAEKSGESIPEGWALDENGQPTTNASAALKGAVLPAGGVKGYGIALAVEVLSAIFTGAAYGPHVQNIYNDNAAAANVGHFFILFDTAIVTPSYQSLKNMLAEMKNSPKAEGTAEIFYPGERRAAFYHKHALSGIELLPETIVELLDLSAEYQVLFPQACT